MFFFSSGRVRRETSTAVGRAETSLALLTQRVPDLQEVQQQQSHLSLTRMEAEAALVMFFLISSRRLRETLAAVGRAETSLTLLTHKVQMEEQSHLSPRAASHPSLPWKAVEVVLFLSLLVWSMQAKRYAVESIAAEASRQGLPLLLLVPSRGSQDPLLPLKLGEATLACFGAAVFLPRPPRIRCPLLREGEDLCLRTSTTPSPTLVCLQRQQTTIQTPPRSPLALAAQRREHLAPGKAASLE